MTLPLPAARRPLLGRTLRDEHAVLESQLVTMHVAIACDHWAECDAAWPHVERRLEDLLSFEETFLLSYAACGATEAAESDLIKREHDAIRSKLDALGLAIQTHHSGALGDIRALLNELRAHAQREERLFYPWLDTLREQRPAAS